MKSRPFFAQAIGPEAEGNLVRIHQDDLDARRQRPATVVAGVTPATGLTLRQAMLFHDEENRAERFYELDMQGYGGDPPPLVQIDGWPTPPEVLCDFGSTLGTGGTTRGDWSSACSRS